MGVDEVRVGYKFLGARTGRTYNIVQLDDTYVYYKWTSDSCKWDGRMSYSKLKVYLDEGTFKPLNYIDDDLLWE